MPKPLYSDGGKTYLAECICRRHTNEVVCSACPPSIRRIFSSGFSLDSAGKRTKSGQSRRAFTCKCCGRRATVSGYLTLAFAVLDSASISACIAIVLNDHPGDSTTRRTLNGILSRLARFEPARALDSLDDSDTHDAPRGLSTLDTDGRSTSPQRYSTAQRLPLVPVSSNRTYPTPTYSVSKKRRRSTERRSPGRDSSPERSILTTAFYKRPRLRIQDRLSHPSATLPPSTTLPPSATLPYVSVPSTVLDRLPPQLSDNITKAFSALSDLATDLIDYFPVSSLTKDSSPERELSPALEVASDTTILYTPGAERNPHDLLSSPNSEPAFEDLPLSRTKRASFLSSPSPVPRSKPSLVVGSKRLAPSHTYSTPLPITTSTTPQPPTTTSTTPQPPTTTSTTPQPPTTTSTTPQPPTTTSTTPQPPTTTLRPPQPPITTLLLTTTKPSEISPDIISDLLVRFDRARDPGGRSAIWKEVRRLKLASAFTAAREKLRRDEGNPKSAGGARGGRTGETCEEEA
jgi:hypothetical protein